MDIQYEKVPIRYLTILTSPGIKCDRSVRFLKYVFYRIGILMSILAWLAESSQFTGLHPYFWHTCIRLGINNYLKLKYECKTVAE